MYSWADRQGNHTQIISMNEFYLQKKLVAKYFGNTLSSSVFAEIFRGVTELFGYQFLRFPEGKIH